MFRHNLILIYRNFKRFKGTFFINLIGLSSGLACVMLIYLWVSDEVSIDKFHKNNGQLYQVMANHHLSDGIMTWTYTPDILAETLVEELPEVDFAAAVINTEDWFGKFTLSVADEKLRTSGQFVGTDFFNMFSFDLIQGSADQVLREKNSIVISESLAVKLFKTSDNVVGKAVEWQLRDWQEQHIITGVFKDVSANSSQQFEFVLSFEVFKDLSAQMGRDLHWDNHAPSTYIVLRDGTISADFSEKIGGFVKGKLPESDVTLFLSPYSDGYLYGQYENGVSTGGRIAYIKLFLLIALLILFIACINFMNLSTAKASRRVKEVGVKKAIGAGRKTLIFQYLGESVLITFISLLVAILWVVLLLPQFNEITGKHLSFDLDTGVIFSFIGISLLTGLIAGSYPAFYLSAFNPVTVLKGKLNKSVGELWARRGLVVFQFALSVVLIVSVLVVYKQIEFIQTQNLGFDKDNVIYFEKEGNIANNPGTLINEIKNMPGIVDVSSIGTPMIGSNATTFGVDWEGKNPEDDINFEQVSVDYNLIETLGIEMKEGRSFSRDFSSDSTKIIFNEAAIKLMGLSNPVGRLANVWGVDYEIIGVVKNFHFESFHKEVNPLFMFLRPHRTNVVMAKIEAGLEKATIGGLEGLYKKYNPGYLWKYKFLDQTYQAQYIAEQRVAILSQYFAGLAILLSCLGLFGLAAFNTERRLKEIGIRKILGSGALGIVRLLSVDFTRMVLTAIVVALPISYLLATNWLSDFAYRIDLQWWFFVGPGLAALLIAWITVSMHTLKAARINPIDCISDE